MTDLPPLPTTITGADLVRWINALNGRVNGLDGQDEPPLEVPSPWEDVRAALDELENRVALAEALRIPGRIAGSAPTAADLPPLTANDEAAYVTLDDQHLHVWDRVAAQWVNVGPYRGPAGLLAGLVEVAPGAWQPTTDADTGWRVIDITDTAQSIRDGSGALHLRRTGFRVTARVLGAGLAAGTGAGFLFPNTLPVGFQARNVTGPAAAGELGGSGHVANRHRVHASSNDIYWCGWSSSSGAFSTSRVAGVTLQGEISWHTDDPWPTTLPGTAV